MVSRLVRTVLFAFLMALTGLITSIAVAEPEAERPAGGEAKSGIDNGFTPLHRAAMAGDVAEVKKILDAGHDVNPPQAKFKGTPLQYAAAQGHVEVVKELLKREAMVDSVDANGRTPLMWAAMNGQTEVVKLLLDADANVGAANDGGWTPLHYAMSYNREKTVKELIERGASQELLNKQGKTPLDVKGTNVERAD